MKRNLDYLCAIMVMGWKYSIGIEGYSDGQWYVGSEDSPDTICQDHEWKPSADLNAALQVIEKAAQGKGYSIYMFPEEKKPYDVELEIYKQCTDAETLPLAMCICSLRAVGVSEKEISKAL